MSDTRRTTRLVAAVLLPLGPACIALLRFLLPGFDATSSAEAVAAVAAHPDRQDAVVWLGTVAVLLLVPSVYWVGRLARRGAPRLTAVALALLVPGYVGLAMMVPADALLWWGVQAEVPADQLAVLAANEHPTALIHVVLFVVGHVVGTVVLGVALLRSGVVPRWVAAVTIVCQPLHFLAAVVLVMPALDLVAWGGNAVAFLAVGIAIARLSDDEWDLPPASPHRTSRDQAQRSSAAVKSSRRSPV